MFLCATKDSMWIRETKIFWVLMEVSVWMWINRRPLLSPIVYNSLRRFADFKADMHNVYIKARNDPAQ